MEGIYVIRWNVRGLASFVNRSNVKRFIQLFNPSVVCLQDSMCIIQSDFQNTQWEFMTYRVFLKYLLVIYLVVSLILRILLSLKWIISTVVGTRYLLEVLLVQLTLEFQSIRYMSLISVI